VIVRKGNCEGRGVWKGRVSGKEKRNCEEGENVRKGRMSGEGVKKEREERVREERMYGERNIEK